MTRFKKFLHLIGADQFPITADVIIRRLIVLGIMLCIAIWIIIFCWTVKEICASF